MNVLARLTGTASGGMAIDSMHSAATSCILPLIIASIPIVASDNNDERRYPGLCRHETIIPVGLDDPERTFSSIVRFVMSLLRAEKAQGSGVKNDRRDNCEDAEPGRALHCKAFQGIGLKEFRRNW
jgi:hypothetical protein